jgi:hypothetical protein
MVDALMDLGGKAPALHWAPGVHPSVCTVLNRSWGCGNTGDHVMEMKKGELGDFKGHIRRAKMNGRNSLG